MTWVKKIPKDGVPDHYCKLPGKSGHLVTLPDDVGVGSLWRCDECFTLWRVKYRCTKCNASKGKPHDGYHSLGLTWDRATFWTRLRYKDQGIDFV